MCQNPFIQTSAHFYVAHPPCRADTRRDRAYSTNGATNLNYFILEVCHADAGNSPRRRTRGNRPLERRPAAQDRGTGIRSSDIRTLALRELPGPHRTRRVGGRRVHRGRPRQLPVTGTPPDLEPTTKWTTNRRSSAVVCRESTPPSFTWNVKRSH